MRLDTFLSFISLFVVLYYIDNDVHNIINGSIRYIMTGRARYIINGEGEKYPYVKELLKEILDEQYNMPEFDSGLEITIKTSDVGDKFLQSRVLGQYSSYNIIIYADMCPSYDEIVDVFHHEMMHHIYYITNIITSVKLLKFGKVSNYVRGYIGDKYKTEEKRNGFVSRYAMYNLEEDIAETYAEYMTSYNHRFNNVVYDDIILYKFKILETFLLDQRLLNMNHLICHNFNNTKRLFSNKCYL